MNQAHADQKSLVDQRHAEMVARLFNMAYNSAMLYGGAHQTTLESAVPLFSALSKSLGKGDALTILAERQSVYVENYCVDKIINVKRMLTHFKKVGLQSITFDSALTIESVRAFFQILSATQTYQTVDAMQGAFAEQQVKGIRLNYVIYRKVTIDEAVVKKGDTIFAVTSPKHSQDEDPLVKQFADVVSIKELLENPKLNLLAKAPESSENTDLDTVVGHLRMINAKIKSGSAVGGFPSTEDMAQAVVKLRKQVLDGLEVLKATAKIGSAQTQVVDELDRMSSEVVIRLIREEYQSGKISIKRLSQLIRRIVPDVRELKRLLPGIKDALLKDGMALADYLQLVSEIRKDLDSDSLAALFETAADDIGVSLDELVSTIKADPTDAARLIVLASEIRSRTKNDTAQLSALLTEYIERVSRSLALSSKELSKQDGIRALKTTVDRLEHELVEKIRKQGVGDTVLLQTSRLLSEHLGAVVPQIKQEWFSRFVTSYQDVGETVLLKICDECIQDDNDLSALGGSVTNLLKRRGYSDEKVAAFFEKVMSRASTPKQQTDVPKGVLTINATLYFLEREVKRHQRYGSPFSTMMLSLSGMKTKDGQIHEAGDQECRALMPQLLSLLRKMLRDLDLVGSIGLISKNIPFIILPMTEEIGAASVVKRLLKDVASQQFDYQGEIVSLDVIISSASFNKEAMKDYRAYLEHALMCHKKTEEKPRAGT